MLRHQDQNWQCNGIACAQKLNELLLLADWCRRHIMDTPQIRVTLSDELLNHLRKRAQEMHVPLRWLVAGLVCDTFESGMKPSNNQRVSFAGR
jgi:hypothetical protein